MQSPISAHTVTIVTAYFPLQRSKHPLSAYQGWLRQFFARVDSAIVVYTTPDFAASIQAVRGPSMAPVMYQPYASIWNTPLAAEFKDLFMGRQHALDPERFIHAPELYGIWDSKAWFLYNASRMDPFRSTYFLWVDAGGFRDNHPYRRWPDPGRVASIFDSRGERVLFSSVGASPWLLPSDRTETQLLTLRATMQGGFVGGTKQALEWFNERNYYYCRKFAQEGIFFGKEQGLYNLLVYTYRQHTMVLDAHNVSARCGDKWFYFRAFVASEKERPSGCELTSILV